MHAENRESKPLCFPCSTLPSPAPPCLFPLSFASWDDSTIDRRTCTPRCFCGGSVCRLGFIWNSVVSHAVCSVLRRPRPSLGPDSSKTSTWFDCGRVFWNTAATLYGSAMTCWVGGGRKARGSDGFVRLSSLQARKVRVNGVVAAGEIIQYCV